MAVLHLQATRCGVVCVMTIVSFLSVLDRCSSFLSAGAAPRVATWLPSSKDDFSFSQRIESLKTAGIGLLSGGLALTPVSLLHNTVDGNLAQWEFDTDTGSLEAALFAIVYRYCVSIYYLREGRNSFCFLKRRFEKTTTRCSIKGSLPLSWWCELCPRSECQCFAPLLLWNVSNALLLRNFDSHSLSYQVGSPWGTLTGRCLLRLFGRSWRVLPCSVLPLPPSIIVFIGIFYPSLETELLHMTLHVL